MLQARTREIAGSSLFDLLIYMRNVILQDAVILMESEEHRAHPVFQHPVFQQVMFMEFRQSLLDLVASTPL
jgi:hypothetical protein